MLSSKPMEDSGGGPSSRRAGGAAMDGVDVRTIERQLRELWEAMAREDSQAVLRACVLNLLVFDEETWEPAAMSETLGTVSRRHPSRILVLVGSAAAGESLRAEVTAECHRVAGGRKHVCCEVIRITSGREALNKVPSVVRPLLVPDLPVVLWWRPDPIFEDRFFQELVSTADRILIDSGRFRVCDERIRKLASLVETRSHRSAFSDLNWSRLTSWRAAVAGFFDIPEFAASLHSLRSLRVEYEAAEPGGDPSFQSLLVAAWLASRLHWRASKPLQQTASDAYGCQVLSQQGAVSMKFRSQPGEAGSGIRRIRLTGGEREEYEFDARADRVQHHIEARVRRDGQPVSTRWIRLDRHSEGELLSGELEILGHDTTYEKALQFSAGIL